MWCFLLKDPKLFHLSSGNCSVPEPSRAVVGNKALTGGELTQPSGQRASYFSQLALSLLWTFHLIDNSASQHVTFSVILFALVRAMLQGKPSAPAGRGWLPRCSSAASRQSGAGCHQCHIPPSASICHPGKSYTAQKLYNFRREFVQQPMDAGPWK